MHVTNAELGTVEFGERSVRVGLSMPGLPF